MAIFYRIDKNVSSFNIDYFFKESIMLDKHLFNLFNEYLKVIQDLQLILDKKDIDLSSHSIIIFNIIIIKIHIIIITQHVNKFLHAVLIIVSRNQLTVKLI